MSKRFRNKFERSPRDFYRTPLVSVKPLVPLLRAAGVREFVEPCCGERDLVRHLEAFGLRCTYAGDIATGQDALSVENFGGVPVVTNPPYTRGILLPLIDHFMRAAPFVWLLMKTDFAHNGYARPFLPHCTDIVAAGREHWFQEPGKTTGFESVCWFRFDANHRAGPVFHNGEFRGKRALICAGCGKPFRPLRSDARTCSDVCRQRARRARLSVTEA